MLFRYKALFNQKIIKGKVEAESDNQAKMYIKNLGYFLIELKKETQTQNLLFFFLNNINFNDIVNFTRQMAIMLNAGLTLIDSFDILKKQTNKIALLRLIEDLEKEIKSGNSFSSALKKHPQYFPNLYVALVKSGEASGKLSDILLKLSQNLEKEREFKSKIKGAMIYPLILIIGMISVMFIMVTFVIPRLLDLYKDFNIDLPLTTKILMSISSVSSRFWPLIIFGVIGVISGIKKIFSTNQGKLFFDQTVLKIPIINNVVKISTLVDSTRTLSILIGAGVSLIESLEIIIEITSNLIYQKSFKNIVKKIEKGISLGQAMQQEQIFPPILVQMTQVGEQTGKLDDTLGRISRYFEMESEMAVKALTTLIEPTILVFMGLGVGVLVSSVITPIYQLTSSFK